MPDAVHTRPVLGCDCARSAVLTIFLVWTLTVTMSVPSMSGASSEPQTVSRKKIGDLYALVVGVSRYRVPKIRRLDFAANDAEAFGKLLEKQQHIFKEKHIRVLTNEKATKRDIEKFLTGDLRKSGPEDSVILFFSGHGIYDPQRTTDFYFCPHDVEPGYYNATAVRMSGLDFLRGLKTKRVLIIADACHAGGFSTRKSKSFPTDMSVFMNDFKNTTGRVIITSAGPREKSWELSEIEGQPKIKNGVFTHFFLQGLRGKADTDRDGTITVSEAYYFASRMTTDATLGEQHPQFEGLFSGSFPITFSGSVVPLRKLQIAFLKAIAAGNVKRVAELRARMIDITNARDDRNRTSLMVAADNGRVRMVEMMLKLRPDLEARSNAGETALTLAAAKGRTEVVKLLLKKGADPNAKNEEGESALTLASRKGHPDVVRDLLEHGANVKAVNKRGSRALHLAAYKGHRDIVEILLEHGAKVGERDFKGRTPRSNAARYGHADVVKTLMAKLPRVKSITPGHDLIEATQLGDETRVRAALEAGADVNMRTAYKDTPLTLAAGLGYLKVVNLLLDQGADVNARIKFNSTALSWAAYNGKTKVARSLIDRGASVNARDKGGSTALTFAAQNGHLDMAKLLSDKGADLNNVAGSGNTPLILASKKGWANVVDYLLGRGARVEPANEEGFTALMEASQNGHLKIVKLLLTRVKNVDERNEDRFSALMLASAKGHQEIVKTLIAKAASLNLSNREGLTALMLAAWNGHEGVVRALLNHGAALLARDMEDNTALMLASAAGQEKIVKMLEEKISRLPPSDHK